jgi:hypothetical protein
MKLLYVQTLTMSMLVCMNMRYVEQLQDLTWHSTKFWTILRARVRNVKPPRGAP